MRTIGSFSYNDVVKYSAKEKLESRKNDLIKFDEKTKKLKRKIASGLNK